MPSLNEVLLAMMLAISKIDPTRMIFSVDKFMGAHCHQYKINELRPASRILINVI